MNPHPDLPAFYNSLLAGLPESTGRERIAWAQTIVDLDIALRDLVGLLREDAKVASRLLWLLSDVAILKPANLHKELPFLLDLMDREGLAPLTCFASYWHYVGVPEENEARAIDLLFQWLSSSETNVTTKTRSIWVLQKLTRKYPELKQELILCLENQMDKYSKDFEKRAHKILRQLRRG